MKAMLLLVSAFLFLFFFGGNAFNVRFVPICVPAARTGMRPPHRQRMWGQECELLGAMSADVFIFRWGVCVHVHPDWMAGVSGHLH